MATAMIGGLIMLALASPQQATTVRADSPDYWRSDIDWAGRERAVYENVLVLDRGDNTGSPVCGVLSSAVAIKGRLPSGETTYFYQTWCEVGQSMPPISGRCRFEIVILPSRDTFISGEHDAPGADSSMEAKLNFRRKQIERFECTVSSDSPTITPGGEPTPPPRI